MTVTRTVSWPNETLERINHLIDETPGAGFSGMVVELVNRGLQSPDIRDRRLGGPSRSVNNTTKRTRRSQGK